MSFQPAYKRVILKLSGESFCRNREGGISMPEVTGISKQIKSLVEAGVQVAIVCGGGNILRGKQFSANSGAVQQSTAHYMGMLATCINGLALQDALEYEGVPTRLQTAKNEIARRYQKNEIVEYHPLPLSAPPESARSIS